MQGSVPSHILGHDGATTEVQTSAGRDGKVDTVSKETVNSDKPESSTQDEDEW